MTRAEEARLRQQVKQLHDELAHPEETENRFLKETSGNQNLDEAARSRVVGTIGSGYKSSPGRQRIGQAPRWQ